MYVFSFASIRHKVSLFDSTVLFIKRNFISIFLPAGGISSLAFYTRTLEEKGIRKTQIHFASSIYAFIGILSVLIVGVPAFIYSLLKNTLGSGDWYGLVAIILILVALFLIYRSLMKKGPFYSLIIKWIPTTEVFLNDLQNSKIDKKTFLFTVLVSIVIEFLGIAQIYVAMLALHAEASFYFALMTYIVSIIFLVISPFLRGLGAIEVSMTFILIRFGFGNVEAIAITLLYRFFEFWVPLFAGVFTFISKLNKLLMRILPAFFLMLLGVVNVVSVLTPAISGRLNLLHDFLPLQIIYASNYLVLFAGIFLLLNAAFMLKGLKTAWWFALALSIVSFIGNITKAIDYEEASLALVVIVFLIATRKEYYIRSNPKLRNVGLQTSLFLTVAIMVYGILGFYFLDKKHFNIDFDLWQSLQYTFQNYFSIRSQTLAPVDSFGNGFLYSINIAGFLSIVFLFYTLIRWGKHDSTVSDEELVLANNLLKSFGKSPLDYFKTYQDKNIFFSKSKKAFISYRISGAFAVVLEDPVSENEIEMERCISEFDKYMYKSGLKSIYYRVPEESLPIYQKLHKKSLFLGQEGVVDLSTFSLTGSNRKSMRNAINKVNEKNIKANVYLPPIKDGDLQKLKSVSDEWLTDMNRKEIIFSQGMFEWDELKKQTLIVAENEEKKIIAFMNVIPDYVKGEATYDLIRKTKDAPGGVMDFILIEFFNYARSLNFNYVNIGFAPLSGSDDRHTFGENSMKFAYEKLKSFAHYKGLREYKEKFDPIWTNKYLVYDHDFDLLKFPVIFSKVIKP